MAKVRKEDVDRFKPRKDDFYKKRRKVGSFNLTDEDVWFMPVELLIRRNKDDSVKEIIAQYAGGKLQAFAIRVKDGKMVIE